jgi:hypothetical protein
MVTDRDLQPRASAPAGLRVKLQRAAIDAHRVVAGDDAGLFMAENRVEIG